MKILLYVPGMPFNGTWRDNGLSLGGSESAALFMAGAWAQQGHTVTVFTTCETELDVDGVGYRFAGAPSDEAPLGRAWQAATLQEHDMCVVQRVSAPFNGHENARLRLWWLHDLALLRQRPLVDLALPFVDHILCVSEFHKAQVSQVWEIAPEHITVTPNGVDYALVANAVTNCSRKAKHLVFASRPERGLAELLQPDGIMAQLPDYTLHLCTYAHAAPQMTAYYQELLQRAQELPNIIQHGPLGKAELYRLLASCQACV